MEARCRRSIGDLPLCNASVVVAPNRVVPVDVVFCLFTNVFLVQFDTETGFVGNGHVSLFVIKYIAIGQIVEDVVR